MLQGFSEMNDSAGSSARPTHRNWGNLWNARVLDNYQGMAIARYSAFWRLHFLVDWFQRSKGGTVGDGRGCENAIANSDDNYLGVGGWR